MYCKYESERSLFLVQIGCCTRNVTHLRSALLLVTVIKEAKCFASILLADIYFVL